MNHDPRQGEWRGDFTRDTFHPDKHFLRVLMQQGRVTLDADFNEQTAILLHYLRTLARDLIGPGAAPAGDAGGFRLDYDKDKGGLVIQRGHYYVEGLLADNEYDCLYAKTWREAKVALPVQPDLTVPEEDELFQALRKASNEWPPFLVFLDVWERHLTAVEDAGIRETALGVGGADTCTRAQVVWQVKAVPWALEERERKLAKNLDERVKELSEKRTALRQKLEERDAQAVEVVKILTDIAELDAVIDHLTNQQDIQVAGLMMERLLERHEPPTLAARLDPGKQTQDLCATSPSAGYRGVENHLYRVEIHQGGKVDDSQPPTFKWSRDNGSVVTAWLGTRGTALEVANVRGFRAGNWVELGNDEDELAGRPGPLVRLAKVEGNTLTPDPGTLIPSRPPESTHPKVRRWDHTQTEECSLATDHAVPIQESGDLQTEAGLVWLDLEDGIQVAFAPDGDYRTGDYWLIPARVATRRIEWPTDGPDKPRFLPRHGVEHHYAPLAMIELGATGVPEMADLRCEFEPCSTPVAPRSKRPAVIVQPPQPVRLPSGGGEAGDVTPGKKTKPSPKKPA